MPTLDDDLLLRLRAADPAPAEPSVPPHEAVAQARRRRGAGRAGRLGAGGAVAALCAAVALPLGPAGAPALADVVARASAAVAVETGSIVRITTEVDVRAADHWRGRRTTWVRADGSGEPDVRMVSDAGVDETSADGVLRAFDPATGRTTRFRGRAVPSIVFRARALLDEARRGDAKPRLDGETTVRGRRALRVVITGAGGEPPLPGDRDVLYVASTPRASTRGAGRTPTTSPRPSSTTGRCPTPPRTGGC
jgi:hypothetical protein